MLTRLALVSIVLTAHAQDDPKDLLLRVSQRVMETVHGLPRYVCTQTVERTEYQLYVSQSLIMGVKLESVEVAGKSQRLRAIPDSG